MRTQALDLGRTGASNLATSEVGNTIYKLSIIIRKESQTDFSILLSFLPAYPVQLSSNTALGASLPASCNLYVPAKMHQCHLLLAVFK